MKRVRSHHSKHRTNPLHRLCTTEGKQHIQTQTDFPITSISSTRRFSTCPEESLAVRESRSRSVCHQDKQNHSFLVLPPATALVSLGVDLATGTSGTYVEGNTEANLCAGTAQPRLLTQFTDLL